MGILDLEEVWAGLGTGLFRLMLHEFAQHPGNGWWWLLQLFLSGRTYFLVPIEAGACSISGLAAKLLVEVESGGSLMESSSEIERSPTRHFSSHWDSLVDLLQHFNNSADLSCRNISSCRWNPTTDWIMRPFSPALTSLFSGISWAQLSTALKNRTDEKRKPRICLSLFRRWVRLYRCCVWLCRCCVRISGAAVDGLMIVCQWCVETAGALWINQIWWSRCNAVVKWRILFNRVMKITQCKQCDKASTYPFKQTRWPDIVWDLTCVNERKRRVNTLQFHNWV